MPSDQTISKLQADVDTLVRAHWEAVKVFVVHEGAIRGVNNWRCRLCGVRGATSFALPHGDDCLAGQAERIVSDAIMKVAGRQ